MQVEHFEHKNSFHIRIVNYTETRKTRYKTKCYTGGFVDDVTQGPIPDAASYPVDYPPIFTEQKIKFPLPHSERVLKCPNCNGGKIRCMRCNGWGEVHCSSCGISFLFNTIE